jgi:predicted DNA-binding transcriptional regulator YafY
MRSLFQLPVDHRYNRGMEMYLCPKENAMSRAERLMELLQSLRRRIYAVTARSLAEELGVSVRTVYRDIETLNSQGASVDGEAGVGFLLRPGYTIPPLMFTPEEIEALVVGARWVIGRADEHLARADSCPTRNRRSLARSVGAGRRNSRIFL